MALVMIMVMMAGVIHDDQRLCVVCWCCVVACVCVCAAAIVDNEEPLTNELLVATHATIILQ